MFAGRPRPLSGSATETTMRIATISLLAISVIAGTVAAMPGIGHSSPDRHPGSGPDSARVSRFLQALGASDPLVCDMAVEGLGNRWGWHNGGTEIGVLRERSVADAARRASMGSPITDRRPVPPLAAALTESNTCVPAPCADAVGRAGSP